MDILLILARLLHIGFGAFWVGAALLNFFFVGPAFQDAGAEGAKVGAAMMKRGMMLWLPVAAIITIVSGFWLYWRVSGGFTPEFMGSRQGQALGTGGLAALVALVLGIAIVRPAMMKAGALGQQAGQVTGAQRDALLAQSRALQVRSASLGRLVTGLLIVALAAMAVARYL
jgi:hypothetical protein